MLRRCPSPPTMGDATFRGMTDFETLVRTRHSVRAFLPDPVPRPIVEQCFELAQQAPSNCNVQPWRVYVASGAMRDRLSAELVRSVERGENASTEDAIDDFRGEYRDLQVACAVELYGRMGVARHDKVARTRAFMRNYEFFDAPHMAMVGMDRSFGMGVALDVGIWLQTLMLAFTERGIACCPMASMRSHPSVVRSVLGIPEDIRLLCGVAFGYEDRAAEVNRTHQPRQPIAQNVVFRDD